jgi:hypothetical protein
MKVNKEETIEELLREHLIKTIENTRKVNKELDLLINQIKGEKKKKENKTPIDLFVKYLKSSTKSMEDARKKLKKKYPKFF